jgi:hypothetical protein
MQALLTRHELAARLRVAVSTLDAWRGAGKGPPAIRISRKRVLFDPADVAAWLATFSEAERAQHTEQPAQQVGAAD